LQVQILWQDGFNQVAPFELLEGIPALDRQQLAERRRSTASAAAGQGAAPAGDSLAIRRLRQQSLSCLVVPGSQRSMPF
jgi:hypothetical protein